MKKTEIAFAYIFIASLIIACIYGTAKLMTHPEYGIIGDIIGAAIIAAGAILVYKTVDFTKDLMK